MSLDLEGIKARAARGINYAEVRDGGHIIGYYADSTADQADADRDALVDEVERLRSELDKVQALALEASDECSGAAETVWALRKARDAAQRALAAAQADAARLRAAMAEIAQELNYEPPLSDGTKTARGIALAMAEGR